MKLFISWSGEISKSIAIEFRDWLPLINKDIKPYMSAEDIEKGAHWSSHVRKELALTSFGILILTPENTHSEWLHFEAGAIVKSVEEGRLVPILFGLKQSDIQQPLALFQTANFDKGDVFKLLRSVNVSAGVEATEDKILDKVFETFWPQLELKIRPLVSKLTTDIRKVSAAPETDIILQELLVLSRQQMRLLSNPEELIGREVLGLLASLLHDLEGTAARLTTRERHLALALTARWYSLVVKLKGYFAQNPQGTEGAKILSEVSRFANYLAEFQRSLSSKSSQGDSREVTLDDLNRDDPETDSKTSALPSNRFP